MHWISASPAGDGSARKERPPVVPGYRLDEVLGRGAGGPVWRAWPEHRSRLKERETAPAADLVAVGLGDRSEDRPGAVAVKIVCSGPAAARELAMLREVHHPFVVPLLDSVVLDGGRLALVLTLAEGGSLRSLVAARGSLTPGELVTVISPLARALADLHARGIEHGDVAPGNVLLERSGRPLLSDLGTIRIIGRSGDEVCGTAGYADPVVLAGGTASPASDVYGLGATGWFALVGEPPPAAPLRPRLAELVPGAPIALVDALEAAVDPEPARRPDALDLARSVHAACRPAPLWRWRAGPEDGGLTRRIGPARAALERGGAAEPAEEGLAERGVVAHEERIRRIEPGARHRAERGLLRRLTATTRQPRAGMSLRQPGPGAPRTGTRGQVPPRTGTRGQVPPRTGTRGQVPPRTGTRGQVLREIRTRGRVAGYVVASGALVFVLWFAAGPVLSWVGVGANGGANGGSSRAAPATADERMASGRAGAARASPVRSTTAGSSSAPSDARGPGAEKTRLNGTEVEGGASAAPGGRPTASKETAGDGARDGPYGDLSAIGTARAVVRELSARRAAWLAATRSDATSPATAPGSPAAAADAAGRRALVVAGLSYRHLALSAREVLVLQAGRDTAVVRATTDVSGYEVVDAAGRVRYRVAPRRGTSALLHLVRTPHGWRVEAVTAP